jgi:hypothetical protein
MKHGQPMEKGLTRKIESKQSNDDTMATIQTNKVITTVIVVVITMLQNTIVVVVLWLASPFGLVVSECS